MQKPSQKVIDAEGVVVSAGKKNYKLENLEDDTFRNKLYATLIYERGGSSFLKYGIMVPILEKMRETESEQRQYLALINKWANMDDITLRNTINNYQV